MRGASGPVAMLGAVVAGVVIGDHLTPGSSLGWLGLAGLAGAIGAVLRAGRLRVLVALVAAACLATGLTARARHGTVDGPVVEAAAARSTATVNGTLVTDPISFRWETSVVISARGRHFLAVAGRPRASRLAVLSAGEQVVLRGRLEPLDERAAARRDLHLAASLRVHDVLDVGPPTSPLMGVANGVRGALLTGVDHVTPAHRALVAAFLLGDTRGLSARMQDDFRRSGLSHLLVVSGSNVAFVLALTGPVRRRMSLGWRFALGVIVVLVFAAATRFEPSVLRASVMAGLAMTASFAGRPVAGLRILVLSVCALLLIDPFLLHSIAFRLSCAASAGILLLAGPIADRIPAPSPIAEPLATTVAAQIAVTPVLIPLAGGVPLVAVPANLAAVWAAGPLTMWGMLASGIAWAVGGTVPFLADAIHAPTALLGTYLTTVAAVAGRLPLVVGPGWSITVAVVAGGLLLVRARSRRLSSDGPHAPPRI